MILILSSSCIFSIIILIVIIWILPDNPIKKTLNTLVTASEETSTKAAESLPSSFTVFQADDRKLNIGKSKVPPVRVKDGKPAFHVTFQRGETLPAGSNAGFTMTPKGFFPTEQLRISFKLFLDDNWPWVEAPGQSIAGKLFGYLMGSGSASGGNFSTTGASLRLTFKDKGQAHGYFYPQLKSNVSKDRGNSLGWTKLDQSKEFQKISSETTGIRVFLPPENDMVFKKGQWNDIVMFVKLNTPGKYDGVLEISVNGITQRTDSVRYRYTDNLKIEQVDISPFFGGGDMSYAPRETTHAWYAEIGFSKT